MPSSLSRRRRPQSMLPFLIVLVTSALLALMLHHVAHLGVLAAVGAAIIVNTLAQVANDWINGPDPFWTVGFVVHLLACLGTNTAVLLMASFASGDMDDG